MREGQSELRRGFFFDRDGVVNRSPGPGYVLRWEDFHFQEGIAEAIRWLRERDWLVFLATSQKGVGKGLMSRRELDRIHRKMQEWLAEEGGGFDAIYAHTGEPDCPWGPKPEPDMITAACEEFHLDPARSWIAGDADRDIAMGRAAGLGGTIRVLGENPVGIPADHTIRDVSEMVELFENVL